MVEFPRSLQTLRSGSEAGMAGRSKAKAAAASPDRSTTQADREFLARVDAAGQQLVVECKADPSAAAKLLREIGAPSPKRKG